MQLESMQLESMNLNLKKTKKIENYRLSGFLSLALKTVHFIFLYFAKLLNSN